MFCFRKHSNDGDEARPVPAPARHSTGQPRTAASMCRRAGQTFRSFKPLLAAALLLSTAVLRSDARFLKFANQPAGIVGIVPSDEDGERVHFVPMASVSAETDREKASEMISVKLLNQFHTRSFKAAEELEMMAADGRPAPIGPDYETVNLSEQTEQTGGDGGGTEIEPPSAVVEVNHADVKENVIEDDFLPSEPMLVVDKPSRGDSRVPETFSITQPNDDASRTSTMGVVLATQNGSPSTTTLTTTTTRTTTSTTTIRKVRQKSLVTRRRASMAAAAAAATTSATTQRSRPTTATTRSAPARLTTPSRKPPAPRIDITKLNLEHLENEPVSFPHFGPPQALQQASQTRVRPRRIRSQNAAQAAEQAAPSCGCQHRKRSLPYPEEEHAEPAGDYDDYDDDDDDDGDYSDYNDVRRSPALYPRLGDRSLLFPVMSRLLAPASADPPAEGSVERAEMVHGTLERLMGIVTIFSHVDEYIQRRTKQSIRRLARLYDSGEMY